MADDHLPRRTVLIVDDEDLVRQIAADLLGHAGFATLLAASAAEALALVAASPKIDAVFTDINMPGELDGLALAAALRERNATLRIVVTSGCLRPDPGELPTDSAFVAKPYSEAELLAAFERV